MRIEVIANKECSAKEKGDLLEKLARDLLRTQSFEVKEQPRLTGSELDLICEHRVSQRKIYVECKARRDALSANVLKNILGEIELHDFDEGWLISTGPLGKDAKGVLHEWEQKSSLNNP